MQSYIIIIALLLSAALATVGHAAPVASRSSGAAPLTVHFWADPEPSDGSGVEPFHDYEYSWNFGDSTSGTWGTSGKSKNTDKGPVAAHVYETPGTYTSTLSVRDATGVVDSETFTITVQDPNTVFAGTKTTCISTTADFTGCPAGAAQVTTTNLSVLSNYTNAGSRVLLRRGSSWSVGSNINFPNNAGPVHIGAFGTCSNPDELGICSNAPIVTMSAGVVFLDASLKADWRLADINFPNATNAGSVLTGGQNPRNILACRLNTTGSGAAINFTSWRDNDSEYIDGLSVISSRISDTGSMSVWIGSERLVFMGNIIANPASSHVVRIWNSYQGVISHNIAYGAPDGMHALKMHGASPQGQPGQTYVGTFAEVGATGLRHLSEFNVVANNTFGGNYPWIVSIAPQNGSLDERVQDLIFEKNRILMDYQYKRGGDTPLGLSAMYVTVKNNVIDATGGDSFVRGIHAYRRGVEFGSQLLQGIRIYNNTIYSRSNHTSGIRAISIHDTVTGAVVANNYASFPNTSSASVLENIGVNTVANNNILTSTAHFTDPNNLSPLARDFSLSTAATDAIGKGATVPVFDDFNSSSRRLPYDVGAFQASTRRIFRNVRVGEVEP